MDSFYKELNEEDHQKAHRNELDFDSPEAIDFDILVEKLWDLKQGLVSPPLSPFHHLRKRQGETGRKRKLERKGEKY